MTATCPTCGKPIDPLRARFARVVSGKIVTYCSQACADGKPEAAPAPPARTAAAPAPARATAAPVTARATPARDEPARAPAAGRGAASPAIPQPMVGDPRSGPEITIIRGEEPAPALSRGDIDDDDDAPRREVERRRRRNRRVFWLSAGIIAGGMAVAVIQTVSPSSPGPVAAEREAPPRRELAPAPPVVDAPPAFDAGDPVAVRERAVSELHQLLASAPTGRVPRITREAARALSRTGDRDALEVLARALADEPSEIARLEVAYALARGGDARGPKALVAALKSSRRDVRADAGRYLVLLNDKRGVPVLETMLAVSQLRLGAAEALAPMRHAHALAVLQQVRGDEKASREEKLRAIVALGTAGKGDVAGELRELLDDREQNVGAARALAALHDPAAAPALAGQLAVPSLQVEAALGLRRLDPDLDPRPYLPGLVGALDSGKDTARVTAAEAILVLTGPAALAERD